MEWEEGRVASAREASTVGCDEMARGRQAVALLHPPRQQFPHPRPTLQTIGPWRNRSRSAEPASAPSPPILPRPPTSSRLRSPSFLLLATFLPVALPAPPSDHFLRRPASTAAPHPFSPPSPAAADSYASKSVRACSALPLSTSPGSKENRPLSLLPAHLPPLPPPHLHQQRPPAK